MNEYPDRRYVLALLCIEDGDTKDTVAGSTWLQKIMYVASKAHPEIECYGFEPNKYGMYSKQLKNMLDGLRRDGLVNIRETPDGKRDPISLTREGRCIADANSKTDNPGVISTLKAVKSVLNNLTYIELIALMYTKFPEMLEKSEQKDNYERLRKEAALSMVKDDKISFSLGVQISGLDRKVFGKELDESRSRQKDWTEERSIETED